jgi:hypothetical protein
LVFEEERDGLNTEFTEEEHPSRKCSGQAEVAEKKRVQTARLRRTGPTSALEIEEREGRFPLEDGEFAILACELRV